MHVTLRVLLREGIILWEKDITYQLVDNLAEIDICGLNYYLLVLCAERTGKWKSRLGRRSAEA